MVFAGSFFAHRTRSIVAYGRPRTRAGRVWPDMAKSYPPLTDENEPMERLRPAIIGHMSDEIFELLLTLTGGFIAGGIGWFLAHWQFNQGLKAQQRERSRQKIEATIGAIDDAMAVIERLRFASRHPSRTNPSRSIYSICRATRGTKFLDLRPKCKGGLPIFVAEISRPNSRHEAILCPHFCLGSPGQRA